MKSDVDFVAEVLAKLESEGLYATGTNLNSMGALPILGEMFTRRDVEALGDSLPRDSAGFVRWPKGWGGFEAALRLIKLYLREGNFEGLLLDVVRKRDSQYEIWLLQPGDSVVALRNLDPDGADAPKGAPGVVTERWNAFDDSAGPLVEWPDYGICNVYPGDVRKAT